MKTEKELELLDWAHGEYNETGSCCHGEVTKDKILDLMKDTTIANIELMLSGELSYNDVQAARDEYQELVDMAIESAVKDIIFEDGIGFNA